MPPDARRVRELFDRAAAMRPDEARAFLEDAARDEPDVRREVESLLQVSTVAGFMESCATTALAPRAVGPYIDLKPLGRGGHGSVYRATHRDTGVVAALKTVRDPTPALLSTIRREIHALAQLRHDGIVRIIDYGVEEGAPWYAMELLDGRTLHDHLVAVDEHASTLPEHPAASVAAPGAGAASGRFSRLPDPERRRLLAIVHRLCDPLAYIHGRGIVHRDLKPANIMIRPDGTPVLVDFGVAAQLPAGLARERMHVDGLIVGTVLYMSPEQVRAELVDARADLYSLGCILFEMVVGRPPFLSDDVAAVLHLHLEGPIPVPSRLVQGVPQELDELCLGLLAKDPRQRIGYAADVAGALERLGVEAAPAPARGRSYLYRPRLVGRDAVLGDVDRKLDELRNGRGGMILVSGESGIGKTRLLMETARHALQRRIEVLSGECRPPRDGPASGGEQAPLGAFLPTLQHLADRCRDLGPGAVRRILGERARVLSPYLAELERLPGVEGQAPPPELPVPEARLRLFASLRDALVALADEGPVLVLLDDLHWGDELSLGFLGYVTRAAPVSRPVLLMGTFRPDEAPLALQRLAQDARVCRMHLDPLPEEAIAAMMSDMLALQGGADELRAMLARDSEGNPFFVAEYLHSAVGEELLLRRSDGRWAVAEGIASISALPLPASVRDLVARRLAHLGPEARSFAEVASVLHRRIDSAVVSEVARMTDTRAFLAVEELMDRHVLDEPSPAQLRFSHDKVREMAYDGIPEPRRRELHAACAEALAERAEPEEVAIHLERADQPARARVLYLEGARRALARYAHGQAERLYRAYLRLCDGPSAERADVLVELGFEVLYGQGRHDEAGAIVRQALSEAEALGHRKAQPRGLRALAAIESARGRIVEAFELCRRAAALAADAGDTVNERMAIEQLAILHQDVGETVQAFELYHRALGLHRAAGDRKNEAKALANLATLHHRERRLDLARATYEEALAVLKRLSELRLQGISLGNLASLELEQGRLTEAEALFRQALARAKEVGNRIGEAEVLANLGMCRLLQGDANDARALTSESLERAREAGDPYLIYQGRLCRASIDLEQGLWEQARDACEELEADATADPRLRGAARALLASIVRLSGGAIVEAERVAREAISSFEEIGDQLEAAKASCELGHVTLASGGDAAEILRRVETVATDLGTTPESELGRSVERLRRAVAARAAGQSLCRGAVLDDLPPGIRARTAT